MHACVQTSLTTNPVDHAILEVARLLLRRWLLLPSTLI